MAENQYYKKEDTRGPPKLKVFLGGLPLHWNEDIVQEFMSRFCRVNSITIHRDHEGNSKKFGFAVIQTWNPDSVYGRHIVPPLYPNEPEQYLEVKQILSRPVFISFGEQAKISEADIFNRFLLMGHPLTAVDLLNPSRMQAPNLTYRLQFEREASTKEITSMRSININGQPGQITSSFQGGNFTNQKSLAQHGQPHQYKSKVNKNYQNAQSPKHSMSHEGGSQPSFGISNLNLSGPSTYSPKKVVSNLPEIVEFDADYLETHHTEGTDKAEASLTRMESLEDTGDLDFTDRNSQPRAVRKLSYSKNRGQEFYPTELGTVTSEQTKDSLEAQYMQSPQPQLMQPLVQSRLFNPMTQGVGAPWTPSPALAGMYPQFQALMPGYPAFQTGVPMQTFTLPAEPVKSKECIIPYYTFPYRE